MHAAKLSPALMTLLPPLACQLGLSLLSEKPGSSHVDDWSHRQLMLLQPFHGVFSFSGFVFCAQIIFPLSLLISTSTVAPSGPYLLDEEYPDNE